MEADEIPLYPSGGRRFSLEDRRAMFLGRHSLEPEGVGEWGALGVALERRGQQLVGGLEGVRVAHGGIGGVATHVNFRRRGYASIALNAAIQTLKDEGATDFALLFCERHNAPFYMGRGWKPFEGEIYAEQRGGRIRFDAIAPYVFGLKREPLKGVIDLCGLAW